MADQDGYARDVRVCVFLGHGFGAESWKRRYARGLIPGLNDCLAYGYYRASGSGWLIEYSEDVVEGLLGKLYRVLLRRILGCDLVHAWRNRARILSADVVWTHTEFDSLAALALFFAKRRSRRPRIIANCVWLFDRWPQFSWPRRTLYQRLLRRADIVTTFSPANTNVAKRLLPDTRCEFIYWGANVDEIRRPSQSPLHSPLQLVSLGSDMHRDWKSLIAAFGNSEKYQVRIASKTIDARLLAGVENIAVVNPSTTVGIRQLYEWADIVVVSVKPNLHASGITVILESIIVAVPVVCSDTGGLRAYVSPDEVRFFPSAKPAAMRAAVDEIARDDEFRFSMTVNAQRRLFEAELTTQGFAARHRRLSEEVLATAG